MAHDKSEELNTGSPTPDTLDIPLTDLDISEMDPKMVAAQYEKLRANRRQLKTECVQLREEIVRVREGMNRMAVLAQKRENTIAEKNAVLAEVASKMVQLGLLNVLGVTMASERRAD